MVLHRRPVGSGGRGPVLGSLYRLGMVDLARLTWIFGHGSLMFDPGFECEVQFPGRAHGWERRFGQPSVRNWGRPGSPAPTCSLAFGSHCDGIVFGVGPGRRASVMRKLMAREASEPITVTVSISGGDVSAHTWVMGSDWNNSTLDELVAAAVHNIGSGGGPSGDAWEYVTGVADALERHSLDDPLVTTYRDALSRRM